MSASHKAVRRSPRPPGWLRHRWTENGYITAWSGPIFPETDCSTELARSTSAWEKPTTDLLHSVLDGLRRL